MPQDKLIALGLVGLSLVGISLSLLDIKQDRVTGRTFSKEQVTLKRILSLSLDGPISESRSRGGGALSLGRSSSQAVQVRDQLLKALKDQSVRGILLRINSPGGTVGITQEIYRAILRLRKKKPVIVSIGDIAASGGYYIASASDYIFANPGSLVGSIGVISHFYNLEETYKKLGVKSITIKAGKYKDIGSPDREMTKEERALWEEILYDTYRQFTEDVYLGRKASKEEYGKLRNQLTKEQVERFSEGLIFSGGIGKKLGLIDYLGGQDEALKKLQILIRKRAKSKTKLDLPVVNSVDPARSFLDKLPIGFSLGSRSGSLADLLAGLSRGNNRVPQICTIASQPVLLIWGGFLEANRLSLSRCYL